MLEWIQSHETAFAWLAILSTVSFVATLIAVPFFVVRVPPDYFLNEESQEKSLGGASGASRVALGIAKSAAGLILVAMGILMLVLPGQGVLTILVGLVLLDVPGTSKLGRWIVQRPPVRRSINWLRRKAGREPLTPDTAQ